MQRNLTKEAILRLNVFNPSPDLTILEQRSKPSLFCAGLLQLLQLQGLTTPTKTTVYYASSNNVATELLTTPYVTQHFEQQSHVVNKSLESVSYRKQLCFRN